MITSRDLNTFQGDLDMIEIDINDNLRYWDGHGGVSTSRSGHRPVPAKRVFENALKARAFADDLIRAADEMDMRLGHAIETLRQREI